MPWLAGTPEMMQSIHDWFIVDIGFSGSGNSCGVYIVKRDKEVFKKDLTYASLIKKFNEFIEHTDKVGLIIEAPLSVAFNNRNPAGRNAIEIEKIGEKTKRHYWYTYPGNLVTLAVIDFLYRVKEQITENKNIFLYEGFVSFKQMPDDLQSTLSTKQSKKPHCEDSEALYKAVQLSQQTTEFNPTPIVDSKNVELMFVGNYIGITLANETIPSVIKIADIADVSSSTTLHVQQLA